MVINRTDVRCVPLHNVLTIYSNFCVMRMICIQMPINIPQRVFSNGNVRKIHITSCLYVHVPETIIIH